jgi:hypothetical protein
VHMDYIVPAIGSRGRQSAGFVPPGTKESEDEGQDWSERVNVVSES